MYKHTLMQVATATRKLGLTTGLIVLAGFCQIGTVSGNTTYWTGGGTDDNWGTSANWANGTTPSGGGSDMIHFAGSNRLTPNNNYGALTQSQQILFDSGAGSFQLNGSEIKLYNNGGTAKIENNSSVLQTINFNGVGDAILTESSVELDPTQGDLTINGNVKADYNSGEIDVYGDGGHTLTLNGVVGQNNTTGSLVVQGNSTVVFNAANTYSGITAINAGAIKVNVAPSNSSGIYYVGNGGGTGTAAALYLGMPAGGVSFNNPISENKGSGGNRTIGGLNTSGTNTFNGTITLNDGNATLTAMAGGAVAFNTITAGTGVNVSVGNSSNTGTVQMVGTADNLNVGATVNYGTLVLAKTGPSSSHAIGTNLTINNGAIVGLGGANGDQIYDAASVTLSGGTLQTNGLSERVGALTLTANSAVDLGSGTSTLTFGGASTRSGGTLSISNWDNGSDHVYFYSGSTGSTAYNFSDSLLGNITIDGFAVTELSTGEIVPVPESATWLAGILMLGTLGYSQHRQVRRWVGLARSPRAA